MTTTTFAVAAILAGVSAVGSSTTMQGADWPSFRGPSHASLRCLDWKTGEIKWTESKLGFNGLIAVGGKLLVLTETGDLVMVEASPQSYKELGSMHVIEGRAFTAPSFANGRVFVRNVRGDVVSLDFGGK
jgi:outer membrane protein assembly factor BamB